MNEWSAALATLSRRNVEAELGPYPFYVERIGGADSIGNGAVSRSPWHYGMTRRGIAESVAVTGVTINGILAGPTESEGVSGFVEAMAKQQNKSTKEMENDFFEHARLHPY